MRVCLMIFCRRIIINKPELLKTKGPLLVAFNHPNSFLDAMMLDVLFDVPLWSLARGDAFKNKKVARILHGLRIMPMYRTSEGVENLTENYKTFDACIAVFKENGAVQIFSEGRCVNEWHLRPLRKGTARLAIRAWEQKIPLKVLPLGINYSTFEGVGKNVIINMGDFITADEIDISASDGARNQAFNARLRSQLEQLIYEIAPDDIATRRKLLVKEPSVMAKVLLFIPAAIGYIINAPLYLPVKNFVRKRASGTGHYDSVMAGLLFLSYPLYLLLLVLIAFLITGSGWSWLLLLIVPFTAWSYVQLKDQLDGQK
jgi:1-acyl-sn-glycerol-3-phosphate acyltransferase